jgi:hypothetical protein
MTIYARGFGWLPMVLTLACGGVEDSNGSTETTSPEGTGSSTGVNPATGASTGEGTSTSPATSDVGESSSGSNTDDGNGSVTQGVTSVGARCDRAARIGSLSVNLSSDRTIVAGAISSGVLPSSVAGVETESGGCELLVPRDLLCSSCTAGEACAGEDMCVPKPSKVSAGDVSVEGLLVDVQVAPNGLTLDYSKTLLDPYPAYDLGAGLTIHAAGDVVEAFEATVYGVPQMVSDLPAVAVKQGEPAKLEWDTENVESDQTSVFISFSVNVHGAVTGWIECTAPDTGSFEIPADLVSSLIDLGLSGFPRVELERRSSATVELEDGCVDVYAGSKVTIEIEVDGLASCNDDDDCADGQTCSPELACE